MIDVADGRLNAALTLLGHNQTTGCAKENHGDQPLTLKPQRRFSHGLQM